LKLRFYGLAQKYVVGKGKTMAQKEAIAVLRDVLAECAGSLLERCVSLSPVDPKTLTDYGHYYYIDLTIVICTNINASVFIV
jgi:hypothetical protein